MNLVEGLGLVIFLDEAGRYLKLGMTDLNTGDTGLLLETGLGEVSPEIGQIGPLDKWVLAVRTEVT